MNFLSKVEFLDQLKKIRKAQGMTQGQLAQKAGISLKSVSLLERGVHCTEYTLGRIAIVLNISIQWHIKESFSIKPIQ